MRLGTTTTFFGARPSSMRLTCGKASAAWLIGAQCRGHLGGHGFRGERGHH